MSILLASVWIFTIAVLHCVHSVGFCLDLHYHCSTLCPSLLASVWIFTITVLHCVHTYCWLLSGSSLLLFYIVSIVLASVWIFTITVLHCVHNYCWLLSGYSLSLFYIVSILLASVWSARQLLHGGVLHVPRDVRVWPVLLAPGGHRPGQWEPTQRTLGRGRGTPPHVLLQRQRRRLHWAAVSWQGPSRVRVMCSGGGGGGGGGGGVIVVVVLRIRP